MLLFLKQYLGNCLSPVSAAIIKYHRPGNFKSEKRGLSSLIALEAGESKSLASTSARFLVKDSGRRSKGKSGNSLPVDLTQCWGGGENMNCFLRVEPKRSLKIPLLLSTVTLGTRFQPEFRRASAMFKP